MHAQALQKDAQLEARIEAFEIAFKMQTEATDAFDITKEPQEVKDLYGATEMGAKLLVARRLVERGVRFVQVAAGGWDNHNDLARSLKGAATNIDNPAAALITDLKQRGLLDSDAHHLGRRIRPHRGARPQWQCQPGPRSQWPRLLLLDGRRRRQGRHHLWRDR